MVRQRKCHTRMKKEFFAQLAGETTLDGQPIERTIEEGESEPSIVLMFGNNKSLITLEDW